jgi:CheY-like chemotaxis protein
MPKTSTILAVDDERFNLDILTEYLTDDGYRVIAASDGIEALEQLALHPEIDLIVLDRMMPRMDGMQLMEHLKRDRNLRDIPVIMQTAAASNTQLLEGIQAGVYYYLTKPYEDVMLLCIVKAAFQSVASKREMREEVRNQKRMLGLLENARFRFRTLEEARHIAYLIANCFPEPETVVYGLSELMVNAVEHGNLGISYQHKTELMRSGQWEAEVKRRLALPEYAEKYATITFEAGASAHTVHITDSGPGFDWQRYLKLSPERATDPNGRGIATARALSFSDIIYEGCGNEVRCIVTHDAKK